MVAGHAYALGGFGGVSKSQAALQLAENVQREELSFTDECTAICNVVFKPFYETKICSLEVMAMVSGYAGKKYDTPGMLTMLQTAKKTA